MNKYWAMIFIKLTVQGESQIRQCQSDCKMGDGSWLQKWASGKNDGGGNIKVQISHQF